MYFHLGRHPIGQEGCTSSRVVDCIALLIVGRKGGYTSVVTNGFALLRGPFGGL